MSCNRFKSLSVIGAAAIATAAVASNVLAAEHVYSKLEASCRTMHIADAGYEVQIERVVSTGQLIATVSEQSFAGPREIGKVRVERANLGRQIVYRSLDLSLSIHPGTRRGRVSGALVPNRDFSVLTCELAGVEPVIINPIDPGMITCMAYFEGYKLDVSKGRCIADGASGCSSPFEFSNLAQCETAYSVIR